MVQPVRLQLFRTKGFHLQLHSQSVNGLPAVKVDRATRWGNPFHTHGDGVPMTREVAVAMFEKQIQTASGYITTHRYDNHYINTLATIRAHLAGKNLACWCPLDGRPCHADVLLHYANM